MLMPSLFDEFFDDFTRPIAAKRIPAPMPQIMKTDVKEFDDGFSLDIDLPGYQKDDLQLALKEGYLTVTATTKTESEENGRILKRERFFGTSSRSYFVGEEITEEDIKAKFENGVLNIFVPKKEKQPEIPETKYIQIA